LLWWMGFGLLGQYEFFLPRDAQAVFLAPMDDDGFALAGEQDLAFYLHRRVSRQPGTRQGMVFVIHGCSGSVANLVRVEAWHVGEDPR
jgi:hypothetical protein